VVKVRFTLTAAEAHAVQRRVFLRSWSVWCFLVFELAIAIVGIIVSSAVLIAIGGASVVVYVAQIWFWRPRRMWRGQGLMRSEQTLTISGEGIAIQYAGAASTTQWNFWKHARRLRDSYVLQGSQRGYTLIPRRAFADAPDEARFRELIAAHLGVALPE
jgi:hypothetical protein